jgi:NAD+ diphosphatase
MDFQFHYNLQNDISPEEEAYWFIFKNEKILVRTEGAGTKPLLIRAGDIACLNIQDALRVGVLDGSSCYAILDRTEHGIEIPGTEWVGLRLSDGKFDYEMFQIYGGARHLLLWAENNRYCGRCGKPLELKPDERCFLCRSCGFTSYPKISPAVIVSIEKDGKLLLARSGRFPQAMYSVLAGFVEPGESLEECVRREIKEEAGIDVKNIRYFKSQPWPYPDSLMIAFTAEYAGGELSIDRNELTDAGWFAPEEFPAIPRKISISRALIDHFVERQKRK